MRGMALMKMPRMGMAGTSLSWGVGFGYSSAMMLLLFRTVFVSSVAVSVLNGHLAVSEVVLDVDSLLTGACVEKEADNNCADGQITKRFVAADEQEEVHRPLRKASLDVV